MISRTQASRTAVVRDTTAVSASLAIVRDAVRSFFRSPDPAEDLSPVNDRSPVDGSHTPPVAGHPTPVSLQGQGARYVECDDGVRLRVETEPVADSAVTVVFVHGIGSGLREFDEQRAGLSGNASLVLYDLRGHGGSDTGPPGEITVQRFAQDLAAVIDETTGPDERIVLIAHSLGGMITLSLIDARPELVGDRVVAIALISTAAERIARVAVPDPLAAGLVRTHAAHGLLRITAWCAPAIDALKPALTLPGRWWLRRTMFGPQQPPPELLSAKQHLWSRTPAAVIASTYRSLMGFDRTRALKTLGRIPVLFVTGTSDRTIPGRRSKRLALQIGATAALLTVDGAGHSVNQTHADEVNAAIHNLIRRARA